jgi:hypothetical protein
MSQVAKNSMACGENSERSKICEMIETLIEKSDDCQTVLAKQILIAIRKMK